MSFGQHLEELRSALLRSVLALAVGVAIGFLPWVGPWVVRFVQEPLQKGLIEFRQEQAKAALKSEGGPSDKVVAERLKQGLLPREFRLSPGELSQAFESSGWQVEAPTGGDSGALLPLTLWMPAEDDPRTRTIGTGVPDAFMVYVKAALLVGVVLSSPVVFYYLWNFVASGLYAHERKFVWLFLPFSIGLFLLGAGVAFFLALGYVLDTLFWFYGWLDIDPTPRIGEWLNFVLLLPLGFGIGFQLPLVMLFLERIGIFTSEQYLKSWRMGVLIIAIASMLLTPSDWQSMVLLAVPMTGLYFGGIALCRFMPRRETPFGDPIDGAASG